MDERPVVAHSMVAMIMMASADGELTRNEIDEMVLLLSIAGREQTPEAVLENLEQQISFVLGMPRQRWSELIGVMRDAAPERKETILFAAAKMAHVEGPPDRQRQALLRQIAEWLGVPENDYRRFTASFAAQLQASRDIAMSGR